MPSFEHSGHAIRCARRLSEYMVPLAATVAAQLPIERGAMGRTVYITDLLNKLGPGSCDMFPGVLGRLAREQRLTRTFATPVIVDDVTILFETEAKRHMYQKTKKLVLRLATADDTAEMAALAATLERGPARSGPAIYTPPISRPELSAPRAVADTGPLAERVAALETALAALRADMIQRTLRAERTANRALMAASPPPDVEAMVALASEES